MASVSGFEPQQRLLTAVADPGGGAEGAMAPRALWK